MTEHIPAPSDGEYLWDEAGQRWVPLVKNEAGGPDVEASIAQADEETPQ